MEALVINDEAVINELNCVEQIYIRFQASFGLNKKVTVRANCLFLGKIVIFRENCYFQVKFFSSPPVECFPVRLW